MRQIGVDSSITRILSDKGDFVGAGFLINKSQVLTCAHVIKEALRPKECIDENPNIEIHLDFPLVKSGFSLTANISFWRPEPRIDIALLEISEELPPGTSPAKMIKEENLLGHRFWSFGFPTNVKDGAWARGEILEKEAKGWIQIEADRTEGYRVAPGFSGSPVWDEDLEGVVGMIVADEKLSAIKVAFMIPSYTLIRTCPPLMLKDFSDIPQEDLTWATDKSVRMLNPCIRDHYNDLAVFPRDATFPENLLKEMWRLDDYAKVIDFLLDKSLIYRNQNGHLELYDFQFDYLASQKKDLPYLHNSLLESYRRMCPDGWSTGPNDGYFFEYLAYHMKEAGRREELRALLLDFNWLQKKLEINGAESLIDNFDSLQGYKDLHLVREAIRLSRKVLVRDSDQLAGQLMGRLIMYGKCTSIKNLLDFIVLSKKTPWLRPLSSSILPPTNESIEKVKKHKKSVNVVAISPNGEFAVSGSYDGSIIVWDLINGEQKYILEHNSEVSSLNLTLDGFLVSGSQGELKFWNIQSGDELETKKIESVSLEHNGIYQMCTPGPISSLLILRKEKWVIFSGFAFYGIWNLENGEIIVHFAYGFYGEDVKLTPDGDGIVISTGIDFSFYDIDKRNDIKDIDLFHSGRYIYSHESHNSPFSRSSGNNPLASTLTPDMSCAIFRLSDGTIEICDVNSGKKRKSFNQGKWQEPPWSIDNCVTVTPDGRNIISWGCQAPDYSSIIKIWDLETGDELRSYRGCFGSILWMDDGRRAISVVHCDETLEVWEPESGEILARFSVEADIDEHAIASLGRIIVVGDKQGGVHILLLENAK